MTLLLFSLMGVILILASGVLPDAPRLLRDFSRELGVVLVTVCSVSMIDEVFVAARHFAQFSKLLRQQIAGGEANAAICERLGIARIYPTRRDFQTAYPLLKVAQSASPDWRFHMVGKSLF